MKNSSKVALHTHDSFGLLL